MKRGFAFTLCAALALFFAACAPDVSSAPVEAEPGGAQIPNPMVEQQSAAAFEALGLRLDAPEGAQDTAYFIISETLADVRFTLAGVAYTYRASALTEDISGVYDTFTPAFTIPMLCDSKPLSAQAVRGAEGGTLVTWRADGVNYSLYTAQEAEEAAVRACVRGVLEKSFASVRDAAQAQADCRRFDEASALVMDLDGDGAVETVTVEIVPEREYEQEKRTVVVTAANGERADATVDIIGAFSGFACDADSDGAVELFACGDIASCDYLTWMFRYANAELIPAAPYAYAEGWAGERIPSASGFVKNIADGVVTIEDTVDLLGSWGGETQYTVSGEPFALVRTPGSVWTRSAANFDAEYWRDCTLKTTQALPVTFEGESAPAMLPAGVKIAITGSDYETYAAFVTEDGRAGRIAVAPDTENWGWLIDGVHESEYFESIPYAG